MMMRKNVLLTGSKLARWSAAFVIGVVLTTAGAGQAKGSGKAKADAAKLEMFIMSQCPYGVQVENAVAPVKKQLGDKLDLSIHYIGDGDKSNLQSMHGPAEVKGDITQLCVNKLAAAKSLDFITCQNKNPRAIDTNWKDCAKEVGVDEAKISKCADGDEGKALLVASFEEAKKRGASGSPTMFLNGKPYEGGRKSRDFLRAACDTFEKDKPEACKNMPVPPVVKAIFFSDARCAKCDIKGLEPRLKSELGGLTVTHVDYMSDEGKKLYAQLQKDKPDFKLLPTVLLDKAVEKDQDGYAALKNFLHPIGEWQEVAVGGKFDPTAEICDNKVDDDGDGKIDCDDSDCSQSMSCRTARPKTLELFVMSHCPYGAKAMIAANDVAQHFGKDLTLEVHFIGNGSEANLQSMHGAAEVDDDVRELCARDHYKADHQYTKYLACRSKDVRNTDWQACAKEAGIDEAVIQKCFEGDGKKLLAEDFRIAQTLGIGASPTFISNGRRQFNAIETAALQKEFCQDNADVEACKTQASVADPAVAAAPVPAGACGK
jgi:predicted DsbA family dithiol-disulfide isomerase